MEDRMNTQVVCTYYKDNRVSSYKNYIGNIREIFIRTGHKKVVFVTISDNDVTAEVVDNDPDNLSAEVRNISP